MDQYTGGGIAWSIGEIPTLILAITVAIQWSRSATSARSAAATGTPTAPATPSSSRVQRAARGARRARRAQPSARRADRAAGPARQPVGSSAETWIDAVPSGSTVIVAVDLKNGHVLGDGLTEPSKSDWMSTSMCATACVRRMAQFAAVGHERHRRAAATIDQTGGVDDAVAGRRSRRGTRWAAAPPASRTAVRNSSTLLLHDPDELRRWARSAGRPGISALGVSESTATPSLAEIAVSTETEYSPGEKTSSGTGSSGSASTPSGDTWRLSTSKPLTCELHRAAHREVDDGQRGWTRTATSERPRSSRHARPGTSTSLVRTGRVVDGDRRVPVELLRPHDLDVGQRRERALAQERLGGRRRQARLLERRGVDATPGTERASAARPCESRSR